MAKKQQSQLGRKVLSVLLIIVGIYFIVAGVLQNNSQNWQAFMLTVGLVLQATGTIGFTKAK